MYTAQILKRNALPLRYDSDNTRLLNTPQQGLHRNCNNVEDNEKDMTDNIQITKDSIEQTYCLLHQKWRIYLHSTMEWQKDDIEYAVAQYVESMNKALYTALSAGNDRFLLSHTTFASDMPKAVETLEHMMAQEHP